MRRYLQHLQEELGIDKALSIYDSEGTHDSFGGHAAVDLEELSSAVNTLTSERTSTGNQRTTG